MNKRDKSLKKNVHGTETRQLCERFIFRLDRRDRARLDALALRLGISRSETLKRGLTLLDVTTNPFQPGLGSSRR